MYNVAWSYAPQALLQFPSRSRPTPPPSQLQVCRCIYFKPPSPVFAAHIYVGWGYSVQHGQPTSSHLTKKRDFSSSHQLSLAPQLETWCQELLHLPCLDVWLAWSCAGTHTYYEFMKAAAKSCPEDSISSPFSVSWSPSAPSSTMFTESWGQGCKVDIKVPFPEEYSVSPF